jgi:membrane-bound lytic murein transglycosylase B
MAFIVRALEALKPNGVLGAIFPASLLSQGSAEKWRDKITDGSQLKFLASIGDYGLFTHDCRRTELFQGELLAALKIVQRGDLRLGDMIGAYAGEIGQTQFLPSSYIKYGVDFDGDGRVDLRHSVADVLASTANLLHTSGFKAGAPYGEGTANFEAMREWNRATIYRKTIGYFADRLVGR